MKLSSRHGFTLIEILVAIAIVGIVLTSVYAAYTGTLKIVDDMQYSDSIYRMARSAMKRMTEDIASLYRFNNSFIFVARPSERGGPAFTDLRFLSSSHLPLRDDDATTLGMVRYYVKEMEDKNYILFRKDTSFRGESEEEEAVEEESARGYVLCDRLKSMAFTFYDGKGGESDTWDSTEEGSASKKSPAIVGVRIEFVNPDAPDAPYVFMTKIYVSMTEGT